jgi:hypothetical protein
MPSKKWMINKSPIGEWWLKKMGNLLGITRPNKGGKLKQLTFCHSKLLKYDSLSNGIEDICDIHM